MPLRDHVLQCTRQLALAAAEGRADVDEACIALTDDIAERTSDLVLRAFLAGGAPTVSQPHRAAS